MTVDEYEHNCKTDAEVQARRLKACAERGCHIVEPEPNQLFVDIDSMHGLGLLHANRPALGTLVQTVACRPSPSGKAGRYHATVTLCRPVKDAFERIMLQLLLGSDVSREAVSFKEATLGLSSPTVFFEKLAKAAPKEVEPTEVTP